MKLKIEYVPIDSIKPYPGNAKQHPDWQVEQIEDSIQEFDFNDPIAVWKDEIATGHGRYMAARNMGIKEIPIIRLDHLTDEQRRAYILAHNKLTMNTGFDKKLLEIELDRIPKIDMERFGFEMPDLPTPDLNDIRDGINKNVFENQEKRQFDTENWYGIPTMQPTQTAGDKLLRFCDFNQVEDHENYIAHFYYDDFKFIAAWREPDKYIEKLKQFKAIISPDFSLYTDFPRALQILSCYRRQWCAAYWQEQGLDVIPDVVWGDAESYKFCFLGIPKHSTVAVSTVGVSRDEEWNNEKDSLFVKGYNEMMDRLEPTTVILYGDEIEGLEGNIIKVPSFYAERRDMLNEKSKRIQEWAEAVQK